MRSQEPRVALVHDFLLDLRGARAGVPGAVRPVPRCGPLHGGLRPGGTEGRFAHRRVHTSFLQRLRPDATSFRRCCRCTPTRWRRWTSPATTSCSSAPRPGRTACCRPRTPSTSATATTRSATPGTRARRRCAPAARSTRAALGAVLQRWRQWDWIAAQRVDRYVANSETTRRRIARYFTRDAEVVYPPVEIERFAPAAPGDHYVVLSELMPHKRIELAVRAFNALRRPLVVIGDGPDARRLQRLAGPTVRFAGPRQRRARSPACWRLARAGRHRDRGVRHRGRRGAGRRAARSSRSTRAA